MPGKTSDELVLACARHSQPQRSSGSSSAKRLRIPAGSHQERQRRAGRGGAARSVSAPVQHCVVRSSAAGQLGGRPIKAHACRGGRTGVGRAREARSRWSIDRLLTRMRTTHVPIGAKLGDLPELGRLRAASAGGRVGPRRAQACQCRACSARARACGRTRMSSPLSPRAIPCTHLEAVANEAHDLAPRRAPLLDGLDKHHVHAPVASLVPERARVSALVCASDDPLRQTTRPPTASSGGAAKALRGARHIAQSMARTLPVRSVTCVGGWAARACAHFPV